MATFLILLGTAPTFFREKRFPLERAAVPKLPPAMTIQALASHEAPQPERTVVVADVFASERNDKYMNNIVTRISIEPSVSDISWERVAPV